MVFTRDGVPRTESSGKTTTEGDRIIFVELFIERLGGKGAHVRLFSGNEAGVLHLRKDSKEGV